jgi:L-threonylcarbamoyladenylate synthase
VPGHFDVAPAAALLRRGGVIAYSTEAVWGLGCDPRNEAAVLRLLQIKQRDIGKGLILIAAQVEDLKPYVDFGALPEAALARVLASWPGPHTWIVPADTGTPRSLTGDHDGIAVRVSAHPTVIALCRAFGGALVSTSANPAGAPPPVALADFDPGLLQAIDGVVEGDTGGLERPTAIRDARTGQVLRS